MSAWSGLISSMGKASDWMTTSIFKLFDLKGLTGLSVRAIFYLIKVVATAQLTYRLWVTGLKLWMFVWVYAYLCQVIIYYVGPLVSGVLALMPGWSQPVMIAVWQFVNATEHIIPWTTVAILAKWYITIRLFLLLFHLVIFIGGWSKRVINFVMGS